MLVKEGTDNIGDFSSFDGNGWTLSFLCPLFLSNDVSLAVRLPAGREKGSSALKSWDTAGGSFATLSSVTCRLNSTVTWKK